MKIFTQSGFFGQVISLVLLVGMTSPMSVFAKSDWQQKESENMLSLTGACSGANVKIELFADESLSVPQYTSGASCQSGHFAFTDDLLEWNLQDRQYALVVGGDKKNIGSIMVRHPKILPKETRSISTSSQESAPASTESKPEASESSTHDASPVQGEKSDTNDAFNEAQGESRTNIENLRESFAKMRTSLAATDYPDSAKAGLGALIGLLDTAVNTIDSIFFQVELRDFPAMEEKSQETPLTSVSVSPENTTTAAVSANTQIDAVGSATTAP